MFCSKINKSLLCLQYTNKQTTPRVLGTAVQGRYFVTRINKVKSVATDGIEILSRYLEVFFYSFILLFLFFIYLLEY